VASQLVASRVVLSSIELVIFQVTIIPTELDVFAVTRLIFGYFRISRNSAAISLLAKMQQ
jgi:hypothetical protein